MSAKIFKVFPIISLWELMSPGAWLIWTLDDFLNFFFHYKSMGANEPRGVANLDPRGMVGSIYVSDHIISSY